MSTAERRQREKENRRAAILDAARVIFHNKGFRDTTIDDIAKATELARGTVYLYFESKEEIYATMLEEGLDILYRMIEEVCDSDADPMANVLAGHAAFFEFHDRYPQYYAVLVLNKTQVESLIPEAVRQRLEGKIAQLAGLIARYIKLGVDTGHFKKLPPLEAAFVQMGAAIGFTVMMDRCVRPGVPADRDVMLGLMRSMVVSSLSESSAPEGSLTGEKPSGAPQ